DQRGCGDDQEGPVEQRGAHRQPAQRRQARLSDLDVHVRDPAVEDEQGGRAPKVRLLCGQPDAGAAVRGEAPVRPASEGRARRGRENAQASRLVTEAGKVQRTTRPPLSRAAASTLPPAAFTTCLTIARPSPLPAEER